MNCSVCRLVFSGWEIKISLFFPVSVYCPLFSLSSLLSLSLPIPPPLLSLSLSICVENISNQMLLQSVAIHKEGVWGREAGRDRACVEAMLVDAQFRGSLGPQGFCSTVRAQQTPGTSRCSVPPMAFPCEADTVDHRSEVGNQLATHVWSQIILDVGAIRFVCIEGEESS